MDPGELYWLKVGAFGQVASAIATVAAVFTSLYLAFAGRKPNLKISVVESIVFGASSDANLNVITFRIVNAGDRPAHIIGLGWRTGRLRKGPKFLKTQMAMQVFSGPNSGKVPPYEIQPGEGVSSYALLAPVVEWACKKKGEPFFCRKWPYFGMRPTRIAGHVYTADGHSFYVDVEPALARKLSEAEPHDFADPNTAVIS